MAKVTLDTGWFRVETLCDIIHDMRECILRRDDIMKSNSEELGKLQKQNFDLIDTCGALRSEIAQLELRNNK